MIRLCIGGPAAGKQVNFDEARDFHVAPKIHYKDTVTESYSDSLPTMATIETIYYVPREVRIDKDVSFLFLVLPRRQKVEEIIEDLVQGYCGE